MNQNRSLTRILGWCALALLAFPSLATAQQVQRNFLGSRYSKEAVAEVLVSQKDWQPYPRTPEAWHAALPADQLKDLVKDGESFIDYEFASIPAVVALDFVRTGDRNRHSRISYGKRDALLQLVVAESIEGKGRFMDPIINGVWSICEESNWGVPAHIGRTGLPDVTDPTVDLFSAETATLMALTDYFVGDKLDAINKMFRKRIAYETDTRMFAPMLANPDRYGWMSKTNAVNNWNPWIMSNWIAATLFLEKDPARRAEMIHAAMIGLDLYLNSLGDDGGCDEGPGYWGAAGASSFDCLDLLARATGGKVNIYGEPLVRNMAAYIYKAHIAGDYYINFADASPRTRPDGRMIYRFGQAIDDPRMAGFGLWLTRDSDSPPSIKGSHKIRSLDGLLIGPKLPAERSGYEELRDAWMADVQVMTARSDGGLFLGTHGGHNAESHNHNDVGDFVIYADGQPVVIDVGSGSYTSRTFSSKRYELWFTRSDHHNLPIIDGKVQGAGRQYAAREVACERTDAAASLTMDIAGAWPADAGVKSWRRQVTLDRKTDCVDVEDAYMLAAAPESLQQVFMTVADVDLSVPGKILFTAPKNTRMALVYDPEVFTAATDQPEQKGPDYGSIPGKWDGRKVTRVLLTVRRPAATGQLHYHFERAD
jgi:hypothetical protein